MRRGVYESESGELGHRDMWPRPPLLLSTRLTSGAQAVFFPTHARSGGQSVFLCRLILHRVLKTKGALLIVSKDAPTDDRWFAALRARAPQIQPTQKSLQ